MAGSTPGAARFAGPGAAVVASDANVVAAIAASLVRADGCHERFAGLTTGDAIGWAAVAVPAVVGTLREVAPLTGATVAAAVAAVTGARLRGVAGAVVVVGR